MITLNYHFSRADSLAFNGAFAISRHLLHPMKYLWLLLLLACLASAQGQIEVPRAASPGGEFTVMIETDKDQKGYELDTLPHMWIEDTRSKKRLAEFDFRGDPSSDMQPLRNKVTTLWSPDGDAVAIQFSERHYSHLHVFRLDGTLAEPKSFEPCPLPKDGEIIKLLVPRFKEFRSRWFQHPEGWIDRHTLLYTAGAGAILHPTGSTANEDVSFMATYRFYVDFSDPKTPLIKKIEYAPEE